MHKDMLHIVDKRIHVHVKTIVIAHIQSLSHQSVHLFEQSSICLPICQSVIYIVNGLNPGVSVVFKV